MIKEGRISEDHLGNATGLVTHRLDKWSLESGLKLRLDHAAIETDSLS